MRYLGLALLLVLSGCATTPIASSGWQKHFCEPIPGSSAKYCYDESAPGATSVLWFFHGLGDSDDVWINPTGIPSSYPDLIAAMPPMRIITITFDQPVSFLNFTFQSGWMLSDYPGRKLSPVDSTVDTFKNVIVPYLEAKYQIKGPYLAMGHSMGGSNLATLWADQKTSNMWKSVTLLNPALITLATDPWNVFQICPWCLMVKANFDNRTEWSAGSPVGLTKAAKALAPIHLTGCSQDVLFALYDGTVELKKLAGSHGVVDWHDGDSGCDHWHFNVPWAIQSLQQGLGVARRGTRVSSSL